MYCPRALLVIDRQTPKFMRPWPKRAPGYNRSSEPDLLGVDHDEDAVLRFLQEYQDSPTTLRSYLKELERFLLWCEQQELGLTDIKRQHALAFLDFIGAPPDCWRGPRARKLDAQGRPSPAWRPFAETSDGAGLGTRSLIKSRKILDSFFRYLVDGNYLYGSPLASRRTKGQLGTASLRPTLERYLPIADIRFLLACLDRAVLRAKTRGQRYAALRCRYIVLLLFFSGLRISEAARHRMGDMVERERRWYLSILGKGDKYREIPVGRELLQALVTFRQAAGFSTLYPGVEESCPLIPRIDRKRAIGTRRIDQILKQGFALAVRNLRLLQQRTTEPLQNDRIQRRISRFEKASAHWLRHSYATYLLKAGASLREAMENLGHADISTLMIYQHVLEEQRHQTVNRLSVAAAPNDAPDQTADSAVSRPVA